MKNTNKTRSFNIQVGMILISLLIISACSPTPSLNKTDEAAIYAAVIWRIYTQDDTFGGNFLSPVVYILQITDDSVGDPELEPLVPHILTDMVRNDINASLKDLPMQILWIGDSSTVPLDPQTGAVIDGGIIMTLGNIHPQKDGSVLVSGSIYISQLGAGGQTYILEQTNSTWEIIGNTGAVWVR